MDTSKPKKLVRTAKGLRDGIFDEWDSLRDGSSNPQKSQAVAKLACQIVNSVKAEIEYQSHVSALKDGTEFPLDKTLVLGSGNAKTKP